MRSILCRALLTCLPSASVVICVRVPNLFLHSLSAHGAENDLRARCLSVSSILSVRKVPVVIKAVIDMSLALLVSKVEDDPTWASK